MKAKSRLIIAGLALAMLMVAGATSVQADSCCGFEALGAPFVAAGQIAASTVVVTTEVTAAVVAAPFNALSCDSCGTNFCSVCGP